ncbi:MAG: hypothetical protein MUC99_12860 [Anaerolineae bacterium]|nr:hypothetical protein [Anaerolineae bacterium]
MLGVILVFVALYLRAQWLSLDRPLTGQNLLGLGGAALVTGLGMLLLPLGAWVMQRWFGQRVGWLGMWRAFFLAQLAKYLPGGFWSIPGRAILYHRQGIPALESGTLVALEMVGLLAGAGVVGLLGVPVFLPQIVPHWGVAVPVTLGGIALAVLMLALARRRWARLGEALRRIPALALAQVCLTYALNWVVLGVAFALIPLALGHPFDRSCPSRWPSSPACWRVCYGHWPK